MIKKIAALIIVIIIIAAAVLLGGKKATLRTMEYKNEPTGVSFVYPSKYVAVGKNVRDDVNQPGVILSSGEDNIAIAIQVKPKVDAQIEKAYYGATFAADPIKRVASSEVTIGEFTGYKVLFNFTKSQYFLFKEGQATSTLVLQIELNSADEAKLLSLENELREILASVTFTK
jgi:hypothetical protein